jgi:hypothetical protein
MIRIAGRPRRGSPERARAKALSRMPHERTGILEIIRFLHDAMDLERHIR